MAVNSQCPSCRELLKVNRAQVERLNDYHLLKLEVSRQKRIIKGQKQEIEKLRAILQEKGKRL